MIKSITQIRASMQLDPLTVFLKYLGSDIQSSIISGFVISFLVLCRQLLEQKSNSLGLKPAVFRQELVHKNVRYSP